MRLWLLRQAHPDLSKLELEVSTSCLSKISLLRLLLGQTNRDKDFPESLRYSVFPNITGYFTFIATHDKRAASGGACFYARNDTNNQGVVSTSTSGDWKADPSLDASRVSSLYQNGLTEVRVNALFGMNLIRAF